MRRGAITIQLGELEFAIRPLTLGQIQDIEPALLSGREEVENPLQVSLTIVGVALRRDYPDIDLLEVEATGKELAAATRQILQHGGFLDGAEPGEEVAA